MSELDEFLAGDRLDDVVIYLREDVLEADSALYELGTTTEDGIVLVVPGEKGRRAFKAGTGMDAMQFAKSAMGTDGEIHRDLSGGTCPEADTEGPAASDHEVEFIFAFAEAENPEVGGLYADGDVVHAYAHCTCGENYAQKWVVGTRTE